MSLSSKPTTSSKLFDSIQAKTVLSHNNVVKLNIGDLKKCQKLVKNEHAEQLFGTISLEEAFHNAWLVLGVIDDENTVVGLAVFNIYPNVPALAPWAWEDWIVNMYDVTEVKNRNTIWLHLVLWDYRYYFFFLRPIMQYLFKFSERLHYAIMVIPPTNCRTDFLGDLGVLIKPKNLQNTRRFQTLYLMSKEHYMVEYIVRGAVVEDNDFIVQMVDKYAPALQEMYGSYYIAEMLTFPQCDRKVIVAEHSQNSKVVAALCVNQQVNYIFLHEEFDLVPYNGLKKSCSRDYIDVACNSEHTDQDVPQEVEGIIEFTKRSYISKSLKTADDEVLLSVSRSESEEFSIIFTSASLYLFLTADEADDDVVSQISTERYCSIYNKESKVVELDDWFSSAFLDSKRKSEDNFLFYGEPNAFALEIAVVLPNCEAAYIKLFQTIFQTFPDRDYCVLLVPSKHKLYTIQRFFNKVTPKSTSSCRYELYVLHKNAMYGIIDVQLATENHLGEISTLLSTIPDSSVALEEIKSCIGDSNSPNMCTVILCDNAVVGMATVTEEYDVNYLRKNYDIYPVSFTYCKSGSHGVIRYLFISPIFHKHARYYLMQIHRLCEFDVLYYKIKPPRGDQYKTLHNLLEFMTPVLPIKQPEHVMDLSVEEGYLDKTIHVDGRESFALYVSTLATLSLPIIRIDKKIVVVGCSHTSIAFLVSLLFGTSHYSVIFNNVTLICSESFEMNMISNKIRDAFLIKKYFIDVRYLNMVNLYSYLNVVKGKITKIDRKEQIVVLEPDRYLAYDLLFLMAGEKFEIPAKFRSAKSVKPENVFVINNALSANNTVAKLRTLYGKYCTKQSKIIVYGHFLQAYCVMHGLIAYGIPSEHIVFIQPFPYCMTIEKRHRQNISMFNNPEIDQAVYNALLSQNIAVHSSYYFLDWEYDPEENIVTAARFESRHNMLTQKCLALFLFSQKEISPRIHKVLSNAGLVYDGRLIINNKCQTNDPKIYGAGTLTKYSRKYYAGNMIHKYYSRIEIGTKLGWQIRDMLFKDFKTARRQHGWLFHLSTRETLVPRYEEPIMRYCRLPGGYYYFSVNKPGPRVPLTIEYEMNGYVLTTGNIRDVNQQGYFRLYLNNNRRVETITCLTKFPVNAYNLFCLWGKHESLLNNFVLRYEMLQIEDLFAYFNEPWCYLLYNNKFEKLQDELDKFLSSTAYSKNQSIVHILIDLFKENKWNRLSEGAIEDLNRTFQKMPYEKIIKQKVLRFIKNNLDTLNLIYAHPYVVKTVLRGYKNSPLFS